MNIFKKTKDALDSIAGNDVKPGQLWLYEPRRRNPFREKISIKYRVIDVRDGYVKYRREDTNQEDSDSISYFKIESHRIE